MGSLPVKFVQSTPLFHELWLGGNFGAVKGLDEEDINSDLGSVSGCLLQSPSPPEGGTALQPNGKYLSVKMQNTVIL